MSSILNLFRSNPRPATPNPSAAIEKLRETSSMLEKREAHLETKIQKEKVNAKRLAQNPRNRNAAMLALKKVKIYEQQLVQLSGSRLTLETQIMAIENATVTYATLNAISSGTRVLRGLNQNMDVGDVEDVLDTFQDQIETAKDIGEALARPVGMDFDDQELEGELDALLEEDLEDKFKDIEIPSTVNVRQQRQPAMDVAVDDDDDLKELEKEMGL